MFHLAAWSASQDQAVLAAIAALTDQAVYTSGNDMAVPDAIPYIIGAYGLGPNITGASIVSPSIRQIFTHRLAALDVAALPAAPFSFIDMTGSPIALDPDEFLDVYASESGAGATRMTVGLWLADGPVQPVGGDIRTIRGTGAVAAVANIWSMIPVTFDEALPKGRYSVVGMRVESTNLQLARLVFRGYPWRPGVVGRASIGAWENPIFRYGTMGEFGQFDHNVPPALEVLANAADTAFVVYLDVIKVS